MHSVMIVWPAWAGDTNREITDIPNVHTNVPEFNDCQRFVVISGQTLAYSGTYAIWAYDSLHRLPNDLISGEGVAPTNPPARFAAVVFSWTDAYPDLGIGIGFNCLYIYNSAAYQAKMVRQDRNPACPLQIPANSAGPNIVTLEVKRAPLTDSLADYPRVARWEWDDVNKKHYVGVMCEGWCEVGKPGFVPAISYAAVTAAALNNAINNNTRLTGLGQARRIYGVKGWYDEQRLAVAAPTPGQLAVGPLKGTAFPHPKLSEARFIGTWDTAAFVAIAPDAGTVPSAVGPALTTYATKFGFSEKSTGTSLTVQTLRQLNTILVCKGTARVACPMPELTADPPCTWPASETQPSLNQRWWAKIVSASGQVRYKCIVRRTHPNEIPPGTVRWRWLSTDDTIWMACDQGCCEVIT